MFSASLPLSRDILYSCCCCLAAKSCLTLHDPMDCSVPGFPVLHYLLEFAQTHVCWVGDAIPSHPLSSPSPLALNLSQHQGLFQLVSSLHQVASLGASASASVLPMDFQDWFPLGLTGLILHIFPPVSDFYESPLQTVFNLCGSQDAHLQITCQLMFTHVTGSKLIDATICLALDVRMGLHWKYAF